MGTARESISPSEGATRSRCATTAAASPRQVVVACPKSTPARNTTTTFSNSASASTASAPKAVNALSKEFYVRSHRSGIRRSLIQAKREAQNDKSGKVADEPDGTLIRFEPDPSIFKTVEFRPELVEAPPASLRLPQHRPEADLHNGWQTFLSRHGLMDLVMEDLQRDSFSEPIYPPLHYASKTLEFCFTHTNSRYGNHFIPSSAANIPATAARTSSAFREGLLKAVNEYAKGKYEGDDVRRCMVSRGDPASRTRYLNRKPKTNWATRKFVPNSSTRCARELLHFFNRNKEVAEKLVAKVQDLLVNARIEEVQKTGARTGRGTYHPHPATQGLQNSTSTRPKRRAGDPWCSSPKANPPPAQS